VKEDKKDFIEGIEICLKRGERDERLWERWEG